MLITNFITKDDILEYLKTLKPTLKKEGIDKLGLFGSFAKDSASFDSDIDILLNTTDLFLQNYPAFKAISRLEDIKKDISNHFGGIKVDIADLAGLDSASIPKEVIYV